jgi:mutual gliding-motility protein MglA
MVLFNYATKEITAKIVYYGPGLCGKTTNLQFVYDSLPSNNKSKMLSLATKTIPSAPFSTSWRVEL